MLVALGAIVVAIAGTGDDEPSPRAARIDPPVPRLDPPEPRPGPEQGRPDPERRSPQPERDRKGYPEGTEERFIRTCEERTPLSEDVCGCVYDRLHDDYDYDEFRDLIEQIDPESRDVPSEILEHIARCRLFG